jgi:2-iminobutanoate/2-iminopropanoate deaminase
MKTERRDRRTFLHRGLAGIGAATAGAAALPEPSSAQRIPHSKQVVRGPGVQPLAGLPFSPAIQFGHLLFVSGQTAHEPKSGKLEDKPFPELVRQCLENVKAVLAAAGSSLDRVLKCTVFLTDMANFQAMNEVYRTYFPNDPPARSTVAVKELPGNTPIEIECIAAVEMPPGPTKG